MPLEQYDVRIRSAPEGTFDVYLYETLRFGIHSNEIDAILKRLGLGAGFGVECILAILSTKVKQIKADVPLKHLALPAPVDIDAVLERPDFTSSYAADAWLKAALESPLEIDALLKGLTVPELWHLDMALRKLGVQSQYQNDALIVLRSHVGMLLDVWFSTLPHVPRQHHIGAYFLAAEKFDIQVLFEQLDVHASFEGLTVTATFEQIQLRPFFQEV